MGPSDGGNRLPPLKDAVWLERFALAEGHAAFVSVPLGATEPRPVMVGVHGAGDRPEWACGGYRAATDAYPFIVCPRGVAEGPSSEKYVTPPAPWIEQDVTAAVHALRARFGACVRLATLGAGSYAMILGGFRADRGFSSLPNVDALACQSRRHLSPVEKVQEQTSIARRG